MKKIISLVLAVVLVACCMSVAAFAEQNVNVRTTAFGNNYDVQDMGWRWMMAACYDGLYRNGQQFYGGDGIVSRGVENTIRNIARLGSDGMLETDQEILRIMTQQ